MTTFLRRTSPLRPRAVQRVHRPNGMEVEVWRHRARAVLTPRDGHSRGVVLQSRGFDGQLLVRLGDGVVDFGLALDGLLQLADLKFVVGRFGL